MAEIQFYHLLTTPLHRALPKLMEKVLSSDMRAVVRVDSQSVMDQLDDAMWEADPGSFIPHGTTQDAHADQQPIYVTTRDENPNGASVLVVADGSLYEQPEQYTKLLDMFDGHNEEAVAAARKRWTHYKDAGLTLRYIQQQKGGGWKQVASANEKE